MTAWEACKVGTEWMREWGRWCAATRAPGAPCSSTPPRGVGAARPARAHHDSRGGPQSPVGCGGREMTAGGPGATRGMEWGCVLAHPGAPPPPPRTPRWQSAPSN